MNHELDNCFVMRRIKHFNVLLNEIQGAIRNSSSSLKKEREEQKNTFEPQLKPHAWMLQTIC